MSENSNSQFHIPSSNYGPDSDGPAYGGALENVYDMYRVIGQSIDNQAGSQSQVEKAVSPMLSRLHDIGDNLERARTEKLQAQPNRRSIDLQIFVSDIAKLLFNRSLSEKSYESLLRNELVAKESKVGAAIFGLKTTDSERSEFFYDGRDGNGVDSWFFHQEKSIDGTGNRQSKTLHYEVLPAGILLVGSGYLQTEELSKFITATEMYNSRVIEQIYSGKEQNHNTHRSNGTMQKIGKAIRLFSKDGYDNNQSAA
jgi:hypothetical protein